MNTRVSSLRMRSLAGAALGGAMLLGALSSQALAAVNPPIHMTHGIEYMSGGIGSDEAKLMETVAPRWPATFEFAIKDHKGAEFASDVHLTVRNGAGTALLDDVVAAGPFMVARLDPGTYEVEARLRGNTLRQTLHVMPDAPARLEFLWPAGTDMASAGTGAVR